MLHGEVNGDVARLGDDPDTSINSFATVNIWPEHRPGTGVDKSVAVGANDWHVSGCCDETCLTIGTDFARLGELRCVYDRASDAESVRLFHDVDGTLGGHPNEHGVGNGRKIGQRREVRVGMNPPDVPLVTESAGLLGGELRPCPADKRD